MCVQRLRAGDICKIYRVEREGEYVTRFDFVLDRERFWGGGGKGRMLLELDGRGIEGGKRERAGRSIVERTISHHSTDEAACLLWMEGRREGGFWYVIGESTFVSTQEDF